MTQSAESRQTQVHTQQELVRAHERAAAIQILRAMAEAIEAGEGTAQYYPGVGEILVQTNAGIGRLPISQQMFCALAEDNLQLAPTPVPLPGAVRLHFESLRWQSNKLLDEIDGIHDLSNDTSLYHVLKELIRGSKNAVAPDLREGVFPALVAYIETFALPQAVVDQVLAAAGRAQSNLEMTKECMRLPNWKENFRLGTRHRLGEAVAAYEGAVRLVHSGPYCRLPQVWWELPSKLEEAGYATVG